MSYSFSKDNFQWGLYFMVGPQGSGKTALATKIVVDYHNNRKIYANYKIKGLDYEHIDPLAIFTIIKDNPTYFNNSIIVIDELHVFFNAYDFFKDHVRQIVGFFSQLRKRNILLVATVQYFKRIPITIREQTKLIFDVSNYKDQSKKFYLNVSRVDGYYQEPIIQNVLIKDLPNYFKYYDTNYIIE